ncbi:hypothetical protein [Cupriavidus sp. RAF20_2]|jgi:hypothetical protein|uniref:hypothetical protein n=1 Tax=Cupriavidus sp. RAF20_2 TaxID=3233053 RepID=UPI003F90284D
MTTPSITSSQRARRVRLSPIAAAGPRHVLEAALRRIAQAVGTLRPAPAEARP